MSLWLDDRIIIKKDSAKYISHFEPTVQDNNIIDIRMVTGTTASATNIAQISIPNEVTRRVFQETDKGENITFVREVNHLMESLES